MKLLTIYTTITLTISVLAQETSFSNQCSIICKSLGTKSSQDLDTCVYECLQAIYKKNNSDTDKPIQFTPKKEVNRNAIQSFLDQGNKPTPTNINSNQYPKNGYTSTNSDSAINTRSSVSSNANSKSSKTASASSSSALPSAQSQEAASTKSKNTSASVSKKNDQSSALIISTQSFFASAFIFSLSYIL